MYLHKASLLEHIHGVRRLYYVIVQPVDSNLLRTEEFQYLKNLLLMASVTTWLGLFGQVVNGHVAVLTNLRGHQRFPAVSFFSQNVSGQLRCHCNVQ